MAAVLQTQLQRDVNPLWDVNGMIAPFESLSHVPPGYTPLVVVDEFELFDDVVVLEPPPQAAIEIKAPKKTNVNPRRRLSAVSSVEIPKMARAARITIIGMTS